MVLDGLHDEHFLPLEVADASFAVAPRAESGGENQHRVVALEHLIDAAYGLAALAAVLVYGQEDVTERLDGHEDVVDKKIDVPAVSALEIVNECHAVEAAQRMVGDNDYAASVGRRENFGVFYGDGDTEVAETATAEIGSTRGKIVAEQFVELVLTDCVLEPFDEEAGDKTGFFAQFVIDNLLQVELYGFVRHGVILAKRKLAELQNHHAFRRKNRTAYRRTKLSK